MCCFKDINNQYPGAPEPEISQSIINHKCRGMITNQDNAIEFRELSHIYFVLSGYLKFIL